MLPDEIIDYLKSIRVRTIKFHLVQFSHIYTRPIKVYRTVLYKNKKGYNLILYLVLYYTLFGMVAMSFPMPEVFVPVLLDVSFLIVPFAVFAIPFRFFTKLNRINIPLRRLFNLMLVLKLQLGMVYTLSWYVGFVTSRETPYFIAMNILGMILLAYFIIPPLLIRVNIGVKLIWITCNFIFYNILLIAHLIVSEYISSYRDLAEIYEQYSVYEPINPMYEFEELMFSPLIIEKVLFDVYMFKVGFDQSDNRRVSFYLVTDDLDSAYTVTYRNQLDSTNYLYLKDSEAEGGLTIACLDSTQASMKRIWDNDRTVLTHFRDSGRFESNVVFCNLALSYVDSYESAHFSVDSVDAFIEQSHHVQRIHFYEGQDTISIIRLYHFSQKQEDQFIALLDEAILLNHRAIFSDFFRSFAELPTNIFLFFRDKSTSGMSIHNQVANCVHI